ncbi:MAG: hypothetical protein ACREEE_08285 [Dongiaceae bacterium]
MLSIFIERLSRAGAACRSAIALVPFALWLGARRRRAAHGTFIHIDESGRITFRRGRRAT